MLKTGMLSVTFSQPTEEAKCEKLKISAQLHNAVHLFKSCKCSLNLTGETTRKARHFP